MVPFILLKWMPTEDNPNIQPTKLAQNMEQDTVMLNAHTISNSFRE
jgi:hypothetical protein